MSLKVRVIATVLWNGQAVVKGRGFAADRVIGTPRQVLRVFAARDIDELVFLDVTATREGRGPDLALIADLAADASFPMAVGGGIRSVEDARAVIRAGADKVVLGTHWELAPTIAAMLGAQAIVVTVDHSRRAHHSDYFDVPAESECCRGGCCICEAEAQNAASDNAGEILLQSIDRDGTLSGYELDLIRSVSEVVSIPVIASGGCSGAADMLAAIRAGASAVAAGALFSFTDTTPATCRVYLSEHGVAVRA